MMKTKREPMVHYISPFGSPAWMPRAEAERYRAEDNRLYELLASFKGGLSEDQRRVGPPRIEKGL